MIQATMFDLGLSVDEVELVPNVPGDYTFTISWTKRYGFLWLKKMRIRGKVRGSCTVWNWYPSGVLCYSGMTSWLYEQYTQQRWMSEDCNATLDNNRSQS